MKRVLTMRAGGTPAVDDPDMWADDGLPWVTITDMSSGVLVTQTARGVSRAGIAAKALPMGRPGTLLFAMYASLGAVAVLGIEASWNQAILGMVPRSGMADGTFIQYWLQHLRRDLGAIARSNTQDNLNAEQVGNLPFPVLSIRHQRAIADYLDRETARIGALIAAKRRMVELLEERRRALRDRAFSSEPGWRLKRLLASSMAYGVLVPQFVGVGEGVPMIRTYNLSATGSVSHEDVAEIPVALAEEYRRTALREGDVILSVVGSMGRSAVVSTAERGFNLNRPLARIQLRADVPARLIWHWIQTTHFMDMARIATGGGTAQPTLNLGDLANFAVGLPLESQRWFAMLAELEEGCGRLDEMEVVVLRQVDLLQERRQALITAAVTGQFEIPGVE